MDKISVIRKTFLLILFLLPYSLFAQQKETGNWLMYFGMNKVSDKFSIHTEVQYRNHTVAPVNIEQLLLRTGVNYHFSHNAFASAGYAYIANHEFESTQTHPESSEHRTWQQFILTNNISRIKFEHRYRIEQRWINGDYKSRFRYRLMLLLPLNKPKIEEGALFVSVYDEVFINGEQPFFDRNRLYGALGYQFRENSSIQLGMMNQRINSLGKWHVQIALIFNPDFRKVEKK